MSALGFRTTTVCRGSAALGITNEQTPVCAGGSAHRGIITLEFYGTHTRCTVCCMKLCDTQLIAEEDYKFARTHTFALLTMVIALRTIKHL